MIEDALQALAERENFDAIRAELDEADEQLARGDFTEYAADNIRNLAEQVKTRGQVRLAGRRILTS